MRAASPLRTILAGTGTNYLKVVVRLLAGLVTFRLLFKRLPAQDFGFYQLLWSTFGYSVLLDFGFGVSVQRAMAISLGRPAAEASRDRREAISTVFWSYLAIDAVMALLLFGAGGRLLAALRFSQGAAGYRTAAAFFAAGMLVAFPLGIFREAQVGLNRMHRTNLIDTLGFALQALVLGAAALGGWTFQHLLEASVASSLVPLFANTALALREPDLRPRLADFRVSRLRGFSTFSLAAWFISATNLLMVQCDQLVIGLLLSVQAVALYMPGAKLASMFLLLSTQMQETLGPVSARFAGGGDEAARRAGLRSLLLVGQRWSAMISTLLVLPLCFDLRAALALITGDHAPPAAMVHGGLLLVGGVYLSVLGTACGRRLLFMNHHHGKLLRLSVTEAALNLGLSVWLVVAWQSPSGAAAGTLIATCCVSALAVPLLSCSALGVPLRTFFVGATLRGLSANGLALAVAALWWGLFPRFHPAGHFLLGCAVTGLAGLPGWWFWGMQQAEREKVASLLERGRARLPSRSSPVARTTTA